MEVILRDHSMAYVPALLSFLPSDSEAFFATSISTMFTTVAFPLLTPHQTVFVFMFLTQILIFQLLGIVPFNLNNVLNGDHGSGFKKGRRKRRGVSEEVQFNEAQTKIIGQIFHIFREIDVNDCIKRSLCEVQAESLRGKNIPVQIQLTLEGFRMLNEKSSIMLQTQNQGNQTLEHVQVFTEAANVGHIIGSSRNSTDNCLNYYSSCPMTTDDILEYIHTMRLDDLI